MKNGQHYRATLVKIRDSLSTYYGPQKDTEKAKAEFQAVHDVYAAIEYLLLKVPS